MATPAEVWSPAENNRGTSCRHQASANWRKGRMKYRLVIFDFDGTLADTLGWVASQMPDIAARYGTRNLDPADYDQIRALPSGELLSYLAIPRSKLPLIMLELRRNMRGDVSNLRLFTGMAEVLSELTDSGIRLAILSSNAERNVREILGPKQELLIGHYQCGVSFSGKTGKLKGLLRKAGVEKAEAFFIGDELRDVEAAVAAGVAFGVVTWGLNNREVFERYSSLSIYERPEDIARDLLAG